MSNKWIITNSIDLEVLSIQLKDDGSFIYQSSLGPESRSYNYWEIKGEYLTLSFNNNFSQYYGKIHDGEVLGTAENIKGLYWNFQAINVDEDFHISGQEEIQDILNNTNKLRRKQEDEYSNIKFKIYDVKSSLLTSKTYNYCAIDYYYAANKYKDVTEDKLAFRNLIYDFKDGIGAVYNDIAVYFSKALFPGGRGAPPTSSGFGPRRKGLWGDTCCIIPASNEKKTRQRFELFCERISILIESKNGYEAIKNINSSDSSHLGEKARGDISNIQIDSEFIKGREILLFDDVITTGKTFVAIADKLMTLGARKVTGVFLAKNVDSVRY